MSSKPLNSCLGCITGANQRVQQVLVNFVHWFFQSVVNAQISKLIYHFWTTHMNGNQLGRVVVLINMDFDLLVLAQRLILRNVFALLCEWHLAAVCLDTTWVGETETFAEGCLRTASSHEDFAGLVVRVDLQLQELTWRNQIRSFDRLDRLLLTFRVLCQLHVGLWHKCLL